MHLRPAKPSQTAGKALYLHVLTCTLARINIQNLDPCEIQLSQEVGTDGKLSGQAHVIDKKST